MTTKHIAAHITEVCDVYTRLAIGILERAKADAARGDLDALAWLVHTGADMADAITDGAGYAVLRFATVTLAAIDAKKIEAEAPWPDVDNTPWRL